METAIPTLWGGRDAKNAKNGEKSAENEGGYCPRSDVRGRRSGKPQSVSIRRDLFASGSVVGFWLGNCPRSEVRGRRSEKVHLREFAFICGPFWAFGGLRRAGKPVFYRKWTQIHANGDREGNFSRKTGNLHENRRGTGHPSCFPVISCFPA